MKPIQVVDGIYWVGAIDWNIRDFHGYSTYRGTTYNAFLVMDEKITLIDTVKKGREDQLLSRVSELVDPKKIDQVVSLHTEMDHSGSLFNVMHRIGEDKPLYCSKMGEKALKAHFGDKWNLQVVQDGGQLSLGRKSFTFLETRMLHWPDSMFAYCPEAKLLFSSDAFGQHFASVERFDDEVGDDIMIHAKKYYANILLPYSNLILKLIEKVSEMNLPLDYICPDHGIMWRRDPGKIIQAYQEWAQQKPTRKAVVVYDTMWQSTHKMAEAIVDGLAKANVRTQLMDLRATHRSDVMTEVMDAGAVIVGSPTLNNGLFPTVADFLCYMKGLRPLNKVGAAFGSYGWSGESIKQIRQDLEGMKFQMIDPSATSQYVPDEAVLEACEKLGLSVGQALPD